MYLFILTDENLTSFKDGLFVSPLKGGLFLFLFLFKIVTINFLFVFLHDLTENFKYVTHPYVIKIKIY